MRIMVTADYFGLLPPSIQALAVGHCRFYQICRRHWVMRMRRTQTRPPRGLPTPLVNKFPFQQRSLSLVHGCSSPWEPVLAFSFVDENKPAASPISDDGVFFNKWRASRARVVIDERRVASTINLP